MKKKMYCKGKIKRKKMKEINKRKKINCLMQHITYIIHQ